MNINPITVKKISILYANTIVNWLVNHHDCILLIDFDMKIL